MQKKRSWPRFLVLTNIAFIIAAMISVQSGPLYFSVDSLDLFQSLNKEHRIAARDLFAEDTLALQELIQADTFGESSGQGNRGLIVLLEEDVAPNTALLLEPSRPLSYEELTFLAEKYEAAIPEIASVEIDQDVVLGSEIPLWLQGFRSAAPESSLVRNPVRVGVIDSGIDASHVIFSDVEIANGYNALDDGNNVFDDVGHGTHVSGIIAKNSEDVVIYPYKVVNANGGRLSNVLKAFDRALDDGVQVVNVSFGFSVDSPALRAMIEVVDDTVVVVAAAGNKRSDFYFFPAAYESTIAVAAVNMFGEKLPNSNYGDWVDAAAYGDRIWSSMPSDSYGSLSGTSQATAFVSAYAVSFFQEGGADIYPSLVDDFLRSGRVIEDGLLKGKTLLP